MITKAILLILGLPLTGIIVKELFSLIGQYLARKHRQKEECGANYVINAKLSKSAKKAVVIIRSHYLFLSTDAHPRRPICPQCAKENIKSYLNLVEPEEGFSCLKAFSSAQLNKTELSCPNCEYSIRLPEDLSLDALQNESNI